MNYGVDAGMQTVLANKLPLHPSVPVALPMPVPTRGGIICPEMQVLVIYVVEFTHSGTQAAGWREGHTYNIPPSAITRYRTS